MKLVVDIHHLGLENAGTRRVTANLLEQFRRMPEIELQEVSPTYSLHRGEGRVAKLMSHVFRFFWVHFHLPIVCIRAKADFVFSPEFNCPMFTACPRGVIAHDAHMRAQREFTSNWWFFLYYIPFIEWPIRRSDIIFTVSGFAKNQIVSLMRLDPQKVHVAYNGVDQKFLSGKSTRRNWLPAGLESKSYVLFVGTFEARKNIERLIEAFSILKKRNKKAEYLRLAIVGQSASARHSNRSRQIAELIKNTGLEKDIVLCGFISDEDLPSLYSQALFIAFPSLHEGFGLPIVEGFASETAVLTSNACAMPEVGGDAVLLVDPTNTNDLAEKMCLLFEDAKLRERLVTLGSARIGNFTWERCAQTIINEIKKVVNK